MECGCHERRVWIMSRLKPAFLLALLAFLFSLAGCAAPAQEPAVDAVAEAGAASAATQQAEDAVLPDTGGDATDDLVVRFLDVGQGDSALITFGGESLLIDGGPKSASQKLYAVLKDLDITHLDHVITTHPDEDHCGGLAGALEFATCGTFYCSVTEHDTDAFNDVADRLHGAPITVPNAGESFMLGQATVQFVGPVASTSDINNGSLVCKLTYGSTSFLFTGDAEASSETQMVDSGTDLHADVLKVAHHGSNTSSSARFLNAVSPEYAVISVGVHNRYGHPTNDALVRLQAVGATILRTDELGTITFQSDGEELSVTASTGKVEPLVPESADQEAIRAALEVEAARVAQEQAAAAEAQRIAEEQAAAEAAAAAAAQQNERTVYVAASGNGKKYHSNPSCSRMKGTISLTVSQAESQGYAPCSKCC